MAETCELARLRGQFVSVFLLISFPSQTLGQTWPLCSLMLTLFPLYYLSLSNEAWVSYLFLTYLSFSRWHCTRAVSSNGSLIQPLIWLSFLDTVFPEHLPPFWSWPAGLGEIGGNLAVASTQDYFTKRQPAMRPKWYHPHLPWVLTTLSLSPWDTSTYFWLQNELISTMQYPLPVWLLSVFLFLELISQIHCVTS